MAPSFFNGGGGGGGRGAPVVYDKSPLCPDDPPPPIKKKERKREQKKERERGKIKNKKSLHVLLFPNEKFDLFLFALQNLKYHRGLTSLTHAFHPHVLAFKSQSLAFMSISFRDLPRLYEYRFRTF